VFKGLKLLKTPGRGA